MIILWLQTRVTLTLSFTEKKYLLITTGSRMVEAILNMDIEKLTEKTEVDNLIAELDKMYLKDENFQACKAYEIFEKFVRPSDMSISEYVIKLEVMLRLNPSTWKY